MNINQELPKEIEIVDPYRKKFIKQVAYDWKPVFCTICAQFGHVCKREEKGPLDHEKGKEQVAQQGLNGGKKMVQKWVGKGIKIAENKAELEEKEIPKIQQENNVIISTPRIVDQASSFYTPPEGWEVCHMLN
ncbi:hypothetical protein FXO38_21084 [Capsicum annuum]|nr:hypothetical protein FXO37_25829 [Capsicum annuum]KAF3642483.1 hypothetical protein FXO38_21084 [Capsicum annuum]